ALLCAKPLEQGALNASIGRRLGKAIRVPSGPPLRPLAASSSPTPSPTALRVCLPGVRPVDSPVLTYVTQVLDALEPGHPHAADQLLRLVYGELRKLAAERMAQERPGQTLQATALVHEAYLRLVDAERAQRWNSRGHFFAAAAEAMRRILVEQARRRNAAKRGGQGNREELEGRSGERWVASGSEWPVVR